MLDLKKRTFVLLLAALMSIGASASSAPAVANFTGPLVTPSVNTMPAGMLNIEPYLIHTQTRGFYDDRGRRHERRTTYRQWQVALPMMVAVSDNSLVQLTLSGSRTHAGGAHSDGMRAGDTSLRFQQRLRAPADDGTGLVVATAVSRQFATGRYHRLDTNPLNGTGNGTGRTTFALGLQRLYWLPDDHALRWRGQLAWSPAPDRVKLRGTSVYGTSEGFRGHVRPGQAWTASLAAEYVLDARWVLVGEAIWNRAAAMTLAGREGEHRLDPRRDLSLAPAVEYHFSSSIGLIAGIQFTVAGRNSADYVAPQVALNMAF